jgi:hypothetical protein
MVKSAFQLLRYFRRTAMLEIVEHVDSRVLLRPVVIHRLQPTQRFLIERKPEP